MGLFGDEKVQDEEVTIYFHDFVNVARSKFVVAAEFNEICRRIDEEVFDEGPWDSRCSLLTAGQIARYLFTAFLHSYIDMDFVSAYELFCASLVLDGCLKGATESFRESYEELVSLYKSKN